MTLPQSVEAAIVAHATEAAPAECCGLLLGTGMTVVDARRTNNVADDPTRRYLIDPHEHLRVIHEARRRAIDVIGAYHSHPHSAPIPSATDRAEGFADFIFLIVGLAAPAPELAAWIWSDGNFTVMPLVRLR